LLLENQPVWAVVYSEIYVNLETNPLKTNDGKKLLIDAYRALFAQQKVGQLPTFRNVNRVNTLTFSEAVHTIYSNNYIVVSDELIVVNLTMLRTRFILDWYTSYPLKDHSLFEFYDVLIRKGYFDAYNQSLFGALLNSTTFGIWMKNNTSQYQEFDQYIKRNPFKPSAQGPQYQ